MTSKSASAHYGGFFEYDEKKERLEEVTRELEDPALWSKPERAQELGFRRVELGTNSVLQAAMHIYESFGFRPFVSDHKTASAKRADRAYFLDLGD